jgi:hypothetical protein
MRRFALALAFGAVLTLFPWVARPVLGDRGAILWLPGFAATSHWFPLGLHGADADAAKAVGCSVNVLIWAGVFLLVSYSVSAGSVRSSDGQKRGS